MIYFLLLLLSSLSLYSADCTIFAHGIVDGPSQMQRFTAAIATPEHVAVQFPDAQEASGWGLNGCIQKCTHLFGKEVNRSAMFMGQGADIEAIVATMGQCLKNTNDPVILYGCSRGAAAITTFMGTHNPANVAALVLDACPSVIHETPCMTIAQLGIHPSYAPTIFKFLFPQYDPETALTPLDAISQIHNKNLPILLIHSQQDSKVPYTDSLKLYQAFINAGFTNVHLTILPSGRHSFLLQDKNVSEAYLSAVHSFYKKYGLPHDVAYAQPTIPSSGLTNQEIGDRITDHKQQIMNTYENACNKIVVARNIGAFVLLCCLCKHFEMI